MRSFFYFIKEALSNTRKNFGTTFGAVITIFLSLLVIGVFMVTSVIIDRIVQSIEEQVSISIFIHDDAPQEAIDAFMGFAQNLPDVKEVIFVTKEESLERFKEWSGSQGSQITDELDGNPLPAVIEINLSDPEQIEAVVTELTAQDVYNSIILEPDNPSKSIRYGEDIVNRLFQVADIIRIVCAALVILLIFVALIFINNTIRLAILARRKEIAIMRLVGASNAFIRGPFLMEGSLQAVVGAGLAIGCISLLCHNLLPMVASYINWLPIDFTSMQLWQIYVVLLGIGLVIGLFGSAWAMRRYLKV